MRMGVVATFGYNRMMVNVTQGTPELRNDLFLTYGKAADQIF